MWIIDQIDETSGMAALENAETLELLHVRASELPPGAKAGSVLLSPGGGWVLHAGLSDERARRISQLFGKIKGRRV